MKKTLSILFTLLLVFTFSFNDADAKTRKKTKKTVSYRHSSAKSKTSEVLDPDYDEEEAKAFAYSYFERPHGCSDLTANKDFFTKSSYKKIKAKVNRMMRNYELQNPGDDPFDVYTNEGSQSELEPSIDSLGNGCFEIKNTTINEFEGDGDPYDIKKARIKVVKVKGEYKIAALYNFVNNMWVP